MGNMFKGFSDDTTENTHIKLADTKQSSSIEADIIAGLDNALLYAMRRDMPVLAEKCNPLKGADHLDTGKPPISMIPRSALEAEAMVFAFGATKYARDNWRKGMKWSKLLDSTLRHIIAYADGEYFDEESKLSHLAHAKCDLSFLIEYATTHPELDDLPKK